MNTPTKCPECGQNTLYHNEGISKKNGKPYANNKCKCGYIEWLEAPKGNTGNDIIIEELQAFRKEMNERLDNMGKWFAEHHDNTK